MEKLNEKSRNKVLQAIKKLCKNTETMRTSNNQPQRIGIAPELTSTTSPTSQENIMMAPRSHQRLTRANTPMTTVPIERDKAPPRQSPRLNPNTEQPVEATTPNCNRIPYNFPNLILQEALNMVTNPVWDNTEDIWTPKDLFIGNVTERASKDNAYDADIEHLCAAVIRPDSGETITQYKKLANDNNNDIK